MGKPHKQFDPKEYHGVKINRWTILDYCSDSTFNRSHAYFYCICECGVKKRIKLESIERGISKSCGCFSVDKSRMMHTKHGISSYENRSEYVSYQSMIKRCTNVNDKKYKYYGGRGIKVCDRWLSDVRLFFIDMGKKPTPKHTLDRYPDMNGNYGPDNCRWATPAEQNRNHRRNVFYEVDGVRICATDWAEKLQINVRTFRGALKRESFNSIYEKYKKNIIVT